MEIIETTLTSKFQLTLPKSLRKLFNLKVGDKLAFLVENNEVVLVPKPDNFTAALSELGEDKSFTDIKKEIRKARKEW